MPHVRRMLALGAIGALAAPAAALASPTEDRLAAAVNEYRRDHGLRALRAAGNLERSSGLAARRILREDEIRHSRPINRSYRFAGENLGWEPGRATDVEAIVAAWAASPAHRRVMLSRRVSYIGVGREYGDIDGRRTTIWVLHVGGR